jgi:hypothetical protein
MAAADLLVSCLLFYLFKLTPRVLFYVLLFCVIYLTKTVLFRTNTAMSHVNFYSLGHWSAVVCTGLHSFAQLWMTHDVFLRVNDVYSREQ